MTVTTSAVAGALRLSDLPELPVTVLLRHDAADAAAVRLVVLLDEEPVELVVDRELLTAGLVAGAADGDVQVQVVGEQALVGVGDLGLALSLRDLADLLLRSYAAAPTGSERDVVIALEEKVTARR